MRDYLEVTLEECENEDALAAIVTHFYEDMGYTDEDVWAKISYESLSSRYYTKKAADYGLIKGNHFTIEMHLNVDPQNVMETSQRVMDILKKYMNTLKAPIGDVRIFIEYVHSSYTETRRDLTNKLK